MNRIHILFPVLNEQNRVEHGIVTTVEFMEAHFQDSYLITVVDNGSTDRTEEISRAMTERYATVRYLRLEERGVGVALRAGVRENSFEIVGYMDIDLSTDLKHLIEMSRLFLQNNVRIVNGSRLSKHSRIVGRSYWRRCTSYGLRFMLKLFLNMKIDDAICGFKFFRKEVIEELMQSTQESNGWFYCIELMIRAERNNIHIAEIPVYWEDDPGTTVNVNKTIANYIKNTFRLRKALKAESKQKEI